MVKIEKIKSLIRENGNPFTFTKPVYVGRYLPSVTGLCISYDTILVFVRGGDCFDIKDADDFVLTTLLASLELHTYYSTI